MNTTIKDKELNLPKAAAFEDDDEDQETYRPNKKQSDPKSKTPILDSFSRDLTKMAEENKIDPIVGRDKEIQRVSQILSRRKKNNPIIIGEPGCVDESTLITVRMISEEGKHNVIVQQL